MANLSPTPSPAQLSPLAWFVKSRKGLILFGVCAFLFACAVALVALAALKEMSWKEATTAFMGVVVGVVAAAWKTIEAIAQEDVAKLNAAATQAAATTTANATTEAAAVTANATKTPDEQLPHTPRGGR